MGKKRLLITLFSIALMVTAVALAVSSIFAATQQAVTSNFTISYAGDPGVSVTINSNYQQAGSSSATSFSQVVINSSTSGVQAVNASNTISLTSTNYYVLLEFEITNNSPIKPVNVQMYNGSTSRNVNVYYYYSQTKISKSGIQSASSSFVSNAQTNWSTSLPALQSIAKQSTNYYYVLVAVIEPTLPASFTSLASTGSESSNLHGIYFNFSKQS